MHEKRTACGKRRDVEFDGVVTEVLPDGHFRVRLENQHEVLAYSAGKMRKFRIRTGVGDERKAKQCRDPEARRTYEEIARHCRAMAEQAERLGGYAT